MEFVLRRKEKMVICVTSTESGDGKTFLSTNLAALYAMTGKKVLLVDLDLRKPNIHTKLGLENGVGVSNYLIGDCTEEEVSELLAAIRNVAQKRNDATSLLNDELMNPIYIETRNFNDYSRWKGAFEAAGFTYHPHLNIRIDTADAAAAIAKIGKHKQHRIKTSLDVGARVITEPTIHQVAEYYDLLRDFYSRHVRKLLPGWEVWETLYHHEACRYILIEHQEHIIGGSVCISWPGKAIYEWYACGRDDKERKISPASLIKYAEIQMAGELHIPLLDLMGAGNPNEPYGVRDFKAEFGGEMVEHGRFLCISKPLLYRIGVWGVKMIKR
jgi:hypothetical protein